MLKNYFKTALRSLLKHKEYSIINILGLAIGMACVILIMMFVQEELSYDQFHTNKDQIYRANISFTNPQTGVTQLRAVGPYRLAKELKPDFPDFKIIRFNPQGRSLVSYEDKSFYELGLAFVDPEVFQVFTFPLLEGDPLTVLDEPFSVVISEEIAQKYYGDEEPIGKILTFRSNDFKVTGILDKMPGNTQFQFDMFASMNSAERVFQRIVLENWGEGSAETFIMLPKDKRPEDYETRLAAFVDVKIQAFRQASPRIVLQPLSDIYLHSQNIAVFAPGGDSTYVYAFTAIAVFILIIACINFMNLATARSANRAKEVGLRKVVGAHRSQLIWQFLSESILLSILSLLIAVGLAYICLPAFNSLAGKELAYNILQNGPMIFGLILITLFVGVVSGSYPALFLSAFKPVSVLSGAVMKGVKGGKLRKFLVTFQFAISIFLIVVTAIVYNQLQYARNLKIGFDKEHLVLLQNIPQTMRQHYDQFRTDLLSNPKIINAAASSRVPPGRLQSSLGTRPEGVPEDQRRGMQTVWTDFDFIESMGFELASGRSFSRDFTTDASSAFILNEAAVKSIGWTNETAIGKSFGSSEIRDWDSGQWEQKDGYVIGVLKDFYFESLRQEIIPTVYFISPYMAWNYVIRIQPGDIQETLDFIEQKWLALNPDLPFLYTFVDDNFESLYRAEEQQGKIFGVFAILAIFVACLGLVGLASFTAEQRTKEVGIRKVLGASVSNIILLMSKEFTWLVLFAFIVAAPFAWYVMDQWLQEFAYHVPLGLGTFFLAGLISILIAWLTVSYQATKIALTNPVNALHYE
ncbi:ABC transporter permease [candidate division KSB1 bacterium]|nr:ABC transporter permease [candidate division KSB1 bacterium]